MSCLDVEDAERGTYVDMPQTSAHCGNILASPDSDLMDLGKGGSATSKCACNFVDENGTSEATVKTIDVILAGV